MTPRCKVTRIKIPFVIVIISLTVIVITYMNNYNWKKEKNTIESLLSGATRRNDKTLIKIIKGANGRRTRSDWIGTPSQETKDSNGRNNRWIKISNELWVYSAFWDARKTVTLPSGVGEGYQVRILAIGPRHKLKMAKTIPQIYCYFKYNASVSQSSDVDVVELDENHDTFRVSQFINCFLPKTVNIPNYVGVSILRGIFPQNWFKIENHFEKKIEKIWDDKNEMELAVCVRPLYGPYNKILQMAEFIAFYSLLGVNRFVFYQYSVSRDVREFWKTLIKDGFDIRIYRWNLSDPANVWAFGQSASIQDCIYSSASHSDYVIMVDLDEFILPRKMNTLPELIKSYPKNDTGLLIRQALFCLEFRSSYPSIEVQKSRMLLTQFKLDRLKNVSPAGHRSKYIVRPVKVLYAGIHDVTRYLEPRHRTTVVSLDDAMTQHYRDDTVPCLSANKHDVIMDFNAKRYAKRLYQSNIFKYDIIKNKLI